MAAALPLALTSGPFLVWTGVRKLQHPERGEGLLESASRSMPFLHPRFESRPERFATALGALEVALGAWLVSGVRRRGAGAALAAFSATTLSLLFTTPGLREEGSAWEPSSQGLPISKDLWLLGAGLSLALGR